jgi:hypothetical protein
MAINPVGMGWGSTSRRETRERRMDQIWFRIYPCQDRDEHFMIPFVTQAYGMKMPEAFS